MKKIFHAVILFLTLLSCSNKKREEEISSIDKFMQGQAAFFEFNGNILVAEKGKAVYQRSFGWADYKTKRPLNDSSIFELASVSKQFTAAGILLLEKQGKLRLDDSLRKFFPELPYQKVTIFHLLTHSSGLADYVEMMMSKWDTSKIATNADLVATLAKEQPPLRFAPGTGYKYSNTGFALLASVIEKASGMRYRDFMAKNIFTPLGMAHTRVYNTRRSGERIDNYAYGYVWENNTYVLPDSLPDYHFVYVLDGIQGDGTVNSTTTDLLKWDRALHDNALLGEKRTKKMLSHYRLTDTANQSWYGFGIRLKKDGFGNYITHGGGWAGYESNITRYVDGDISIIILSNNNAESTQYIPQTIMHILQGGSILYPYRHRQVTADTAALQSFTGTFAVKGDGDNVEIVRTKEGLFQRMQGDDGFMLPLLPESGSKVFNGIPGYDVQFEKEQTPGGGTKYYRVRFGVKEEMKKIK